VSTNHRALFCLPAALLAIPALTSPAPAAPASTLAAPPPGIRFNSQLDGGLHTLNASGFGDTSDSLGTSSRRGKSASRFASGTGNILFLAAGTLLPLVEDGRDGREHTLRTADSVLTSTLITEALKHVVRERRPDNGPRNSFPSGHATAAFAVATMQAHYHPGQALLWYGGATLIAASRVDLRRHYVQDVVAGAAVGYFTSRLELRRSRGLLLFPLIRPRRQGTTTGVSVSGGF